MFRKIRDAFIDHTAKAIAASLFAFVAGSLGALWITYKDQTLEVIKGILSSVWAWFFATHTINNALGWLLVYPLAIIGVAFFVLRFLPKRKLTYRDYRRDVFDDMLFSWTWYTDGRPALEDYPICPKCKFALDPINGGDIRVIIGFICGDCQTHYRIPAEADKWDFGGYYKKRIKQRVDDGTFEKRIKAMKKI